MKFQFKIQPFQTEAADSKQYGIKARFFVYNSSNLHQLDEYSQNSGINVMIINTQAFNTTMYIHVRKVAYITGYAAGTLDVLEQHQAVNAVFLRLEVRTPFHDG